MIESDIYNTPKSDLDTQLSSQKNKPSWISRFILTFIASQIVFIVLAISFSQGQQIYLGILGGAIFSIFAGIVAICIPVKRKRIFIPAGVIASFMFAFIIGTVIGA